VMPDIVVDIFYDQDRGLLKVTWTQGDRSQPHYFVSQNRIEERSIGVRKALQDVVDAGREKRYKDYDDLVRKTAEEGFRLYNALFFGEGPEDKRNAKRALTWVERLTAGEDTITFRLPSRSHFPWGLIYDREVPQQTDRCELQKNFWCEKYSTRAHYFTNLPEWEEKPWPRPPFSLVFGADQQLWSVTCTKLQKQQRLSDLLAGVRQPIFTVDGLSKQWTDQTNNESLTLLAFYCHATGEYLSIGGEEISYLDFEEKFARTKETPPTLVLLAGCNTAIGDLHKGFFKATTATGYCGFIGTEVKVPDMFTLCFTLRFFERFLSTGETVVQILHDLRIKHWPLSLVFSLCCSANLRLEPSGTSGLIDDRNLSLECVSSE
jgi:hypothetical protein